MSAHRPSVYERFIAELDALTIRADDPAVKVVGDLTRAVKRAQNSWDDETDALLRIYDAVMADPPAAPPVVESP